MEDGEIQHPAVRHVELGVDGRLEGRQRVRGHVEVEPHLAAAGRRGLQRIEHHVAAGAYDDVEPVVFLARRPADALDAGEVHHAAVGGRDLVPLLPVAVVVVVKEAGQGRQVEQAARAVGREDGVRAAAREARGRVTRGGDRDVPAAADVRPGLVPGKLGRRRRRVERAVVRGHPAVDLGEVQHREAPSGIDHERGVGAEFQVGHLLGARHVELHRHGAGNDDGVLLGERVDGDVRRVPVGRVVVTARCAPAGPGGGGEGDGRGGGQQQNGGETEDGQRVPAGRCSAHGTISLFAESYGPMGVSFRGRTGRRETCDRRPPAGGRRMRRGRPSRRRAFPQRRSKTDSPTSRRPVPGRNP